MDETKYILRLYKVKENGNSRVMQKNKAGTGKMAGRHVYKYKIRLWEKRRIKRS